MVPTSVGFRGGVFAAAAAGRTAYVFGRVDVVVRHGRPTRSGGTGLVRIGGPDRADVVSPTCNALHLLHVAVVRLWGIVVLCHGDGRTEESVQNVIRCYALQVGIKCRWKAGTRGIGGAGVLNGGYKR